MAREIHVGDEVFVHGHTSLWRCLYFDQVGKGIVHVACAQVLANGGLGVQLRWYARSQLELARVAEARR